LSFLKDHTHALLRDEVEWIVGAMARIR
jgi:hypothetical protein